MQGAVRHPASLGDGLSQGPGGAAAVLVGRKGPGALRREISEG